MGSDNWACVGRIKPRAKALPDSNKVPGECTELAAIFGSGILASDIQLAECEDVNRNYYMFSWLGETRGSLESRYGDLGDEYGESERIGLILDNLPQITSDVTKTYDAVRRPNSDKVYVGDRNRNIIPITDITDFDYDQIAPQWDRDTESYVKEVDGKTYRELFGKEGEDFLKQAIELKAAGWQFFIYGFSG